MHKIMQKSVSLTGVQSNARAEINRVVSSMMGIPNYDTETLAGVWGAEPSVRGSKEPPGG